MPIYLYEAKTMQGTLKKGRIEAIDEHAVVAVLREMNCWLTSLKEEGTGGLNTEIELFSKLTTKEISIFCRQFSFILSAGMTIMRAIDIIRQQSESKKLKSILSKVSEDVQKGISLSSAMEKHKEFPELLINMVNVGETGGNLDIIMIKMADYYNKEYKQKQKVKQALTYPAVISVFGILIVSILVIKILPMIISTLQSSGTKQELPAPTKILLGFSSFLQNYGIIFLGIIFLVVILFHIYGSKDENREKIDKIKLSLPLFGKINMKMSTAIFARTFGMLMSSGLPIIQSIEVTARIVGNKYIQKILTEVKNNIEKGVSLGSILVQKNIFPIMLTSMIRIGEESGNMEEVLEKTADFYDEEVETTVAQMTTLIEPIIIIVLAVVVGFIIVSIILPIFQMNDAVG